MKDFTAAQWPTISSGGKISSCVRSSGRKFSLSNSFGFSFGLGKEETEWDLDYQDITAGYVRRSRITSKQEKVELTSLGPSAVSSPLRQHFAPLLPLQQLAFCWHKCLITSKTFTKIRYFLLNLLLCDAVRWSKLIVAGWSPDRRSCSRPLWVDIQYSDTDYLKSNNTVSMSLDGLQHQPFVLLTWTSKTICSLTWACMVICNKYGGCLWY